MTHTDYYTDLRETLALFFEEAEIVYPDGPAFLRLRVPSGTLFLAERIDEEIGAVEEEWAIGILSADGLTVCDEDEPPVSVRIPEETALELGQDATVYAIVRAILGWID